MPSSSNAIRAISSTVAKRIVTIVAIIATVVLIALLLIIWSLAHYVSAWWWLLLCMYLPMLFTTTLVIGFASWLSRRIYPVRLTKGQRRDVKEFTTKLSRLIEARGLGWWMFAFTSMRELIMYRDLRTMRSIMNDSTTIKSDFDHLSRSL